MTEGETRGLQDALEVILFTVTEPISSYQIARLLDEGGWGSAEKAMTPGQVEKLIEQLVLEWEAAGRPLTALRIAGGYQMATRPEWSGLVAKLQEDRRGQRLSRAALETLAIIAYRQPVIRPDIDAVRGVNSESSIKTLLERGLITISGRDEGPGRPLLYRTTSQFLKYFGLMGLDDLPDQEELASLFGTSLTEAMRAMEIDTGLPDGDDGATAETAVRSVEPPREHGGSSRAGLVGGVIPGADELEDVGGVVGGGEAEDDDDDDDEEEEEEESAP